MTFHLKKLLLLGILTSLTTASGWFGLQYLRGGQNPPLYNDGLPGEFEHQQAILMGWETLRADSATSKVQQEQQRVLVNVAKALAGNVQLVVLVESQREELLAANAFQVAGVPINDVVFVQLPFDSMWTQDYGPFVVRKDGKTKWIDCLYFPAGHNRPKDEQLPSLLGQLHGTETRDLRLVVHGGLMLSNGEGLYLTTKDILKWNSHLKKEEIDRLLKTHLGAQQVIYLEPLADEPTGHVDIFATFTDANTVVVGQFRDDQDATNAKILNATARRLAKVRTATGRLRVVRIPMPPRGVKVWGGTYTNVVYANHVLLMPTYGFDKSGEEQALAVYRRLLPNWRIVGVDSRALIAEEGALHCAVKHLPIFNAPIP